jgi:hypothetical protein
MDPDLRQRRRVRHGLVPPVRLELFRIPALRAGLQTFLAQNLILMGAFFSIPLYLQLVVGLSALETGVRMLPVSIAMFVTSLSGSVLAMRFSPRTIVRAGFGVLVVALLLLIAAIEPALRSGGFAFAMAMLGIGMGLVASQLGNVVQSAVGPAERRGGRAPMDRTATRIFAGCRGRRPPGGAPRRSGGRGAPPDRGDAGEGGVHGRVARNGGTGAVAHVQGVPVLGRLDGGTPPAAGDRRRAPGSARPGRARR